MGYTNFQVEQDPDNTYPQAPFRGKQTIDGYDIYRLAANIQSGVALFLGANGLNPSLTTPLSDYLIAAKSNIGDRVVCIGTKIFKTGTTLSSTATSIVSTRLFNGLVTEADVIRLSYTFDVQKNHLLRFILYNNMRRLIGTRHRNSPVLHTHSKITCGFKHDQSTQFPDSIIKAYGTNAGEVTELMSSLLRASDLEYKLSSALRITPEMQFTVLPTDKLDEIIQIPHTVSDKQFSAGLDRSKFNVALQLSQLVPTSTP